MFFGRGKSKSERFSSFDARSVESETIKRWREIASKKYPSPSSEENQSNSEWKVDDSYRLTTHRLEQEHAGPPTIQLTDEAVVESGEAYRCDLQINLDDGTALDSTQFDTDANDASYISVEQLREQLSSKDTTELNYADEVYCEAESLEQVRENILSTTLEETEAERETLAPQLEKNSVPEPISPQPRLQDEGALGISPCDFSLTPEEDIRRRFGEGLRSALGPGTVVEGTFRFDSPVCIDGMLSGEVSSSSALIVGEQAEVDAAVKVGSLIVLGTVKGEVEAQDLVEIRAGGCIQGDIISRRLVIEDGAVFMGTCNMP